MMHPQHHHHQHHHAQQQQQQQQLTGIETPHDHDVLSGRGNFVNYHTGNEHFRALVRKHKVAYVACPKPQKGKFSQMIVDEIRQRDPPGRFLKQDLKTKFWYDIGEKKALDKTRQALREGAPEIQKELSGEADDDDDCPRGGGSPTLDDYPQQLPQENMLTSMMHVGSGGGNVVRRYSAHEAGSNVGVGGGAYDPLFNNSMMPPPAPHAPSSMHPSQQMQQQQQQQQQQQHQGYHNVHVEQLQQQQQQQQHLHMLDNPALSNSSYGGGSLNLSPDSVIAHQKQLQQQQQQQQQQHHQVPSSSNCGGMEPYTTSHTNGIRATNENNMRNIVFLPQTEPVKDIYFNPLESPRALSNPFALPSSSEQQHQRQQQQHQQQQQSVFGGVNRYKGGTSSSSSPQRGHNHRRIPKGNKGDFKYEHQPSVSSLAVDKIFSEDKRGMAGLGSIKSALGSSNLSVMSLSIDGTDPDSLGPLLNTSLRLSNHTSGYGRNHSRRTINDGDSSSNYEKGMSSIFEMSVNTLGDQLSEFGDSGALRMTDSQAEMSIGNVFDDSDGRDAYARASGYR